LSIEWTFLMTEISNLSRKTKNSRPNNVKKVYLDVLVILAITTVKFNL